MTSYRCEVTYTVEDKTEKRIVILARIPVKDDYVMIDGDYFIVAAVVLVPLQQGLPAEARLQAHAVFDPIRK